MHDTQFIELCFFTLFGVMVHDVVEHVVRYKCSFMLLGLKKADTSYAFICVSNGISASDFINYLDLVSAFFCCEFIDLLWYMILKAAGENALIMRLTWCRCSLY